MIAEQLNAQFDVQEEEDDGDENEGHDGLYLKSQMEDGRYI